MTNASLAALIGTLAFGLGALSGAFLAFAKHRRDVREFARLTGKAEMSEAAVAEMKMALAGKEAALEEVRAALKTAERERAVVQTRLEEAVKNVEEQKGLLDRARDEMTTAFQALSGESLKSNNRAFLELARESLGIVMSEAKGELAKKEESIRNIVKPLENALLRYEAQIGELEKSRISAYSNLESQIRALVSSENQLQKETGNLVAALRRPEVRGRWGEVTLKRVVELAGMSEHCDYTEQASVDTDDGRLRPDMIVHLPSGRDIVIDSKVSLDAYLDAVGSQDGEKRDALIERHAQQVKRHMRALSEKSYWDQFPKAPEFVVMFMPGESFLCAALDIDNTLIEEGMRSRVIIATPTTLIALLRAIAFGWRQELLAKNAQRIASIGKELYDRFQPFMEHVNRVGYNLAQSAESFNKMVRSLETRVMVSVRKFQELGAAGEKELPDLEEIEHVSPPIRQETPSDTA